MLKNNLVLCGFMGSGKSRIGKYLASKLRIRFEDLDDCIQEELQLSIPQIFDKFGQNYFRELEYNMLNAKVSDTNRVLSLGGGSLSSDSVVEKIKSSNLLIFISPDFSELINRIYGKSKRPLVMHPNGSFKSIHELTKDLLPLYESRLGYYQKAHIQFKPEPSWSPEKSGAELLRLITQYDHEIQH